VQVRRRGSTVEKRSDQISISEPAAGNAVTSAAPGTTIDPVCGMEVEIATAMHHTTLEGRDFYFCCPACKRLFERNPQEYLVKPAE
jgi:xanthine dehydrogenase accessory factor